MYVSVNELLAVSSVSVAATLMLLDPTELVTGSMIGSFGVTIGEVVTMEFIRGSGGVGVDLDVDPFTSKSDACTVFLGELFLAHRNC